MAKLFSVEGYLDPVCVDFETDIIKSRPEYPPKPTGVSIQYPGEEPVYWAWGHPTRNNCTKKEAKAALKHAYENYPILFHNAKFDLDVGNTHMGMSLIPKHGYHDTVFLAFLIDPHSDTLKLKDMADKHLDLPPDEQRELYDWLHVNQAEFAHKYPTLFSKLPSGKYRRQPKKWSKWGAVIAESPGDLCGKYANGDTLRTTLLFEKFIDQCERMGMLDSYRRELALMPILLENERKGVKVDLERLRSDLDLSEKAMVETDKWLASRLNSPDLNVDAGESLANALEHAGVVKRSDWKRTKTGKRSTSKDNIAACIEDDEIIEVLKYRSLLGTSLKLYLRKWTELSEANNGYIFTNWNQTRNVDASGKGKGARTGRMSSNPNFQNMTKYPLPVFFSTRDVKEEITKRAKRMVKEVEEANGEMSIKQATEKVSSEFNYILLPKAFAKFAVKMPKIRNYIVPDSDDEVLIVRDYSQQELRILAHFAGGEILEAYLLNPAMDLHQYVLKMVNEMTEGGFTRKQIKAVNFGLIYGMGLSLLADNMGSDKDTAKKVKRAVLQAIPGLKKIDTWCKNQGKSSQPIQTWGGRVYYVEPPKLMQDKDWETGEVKRDENGEIVMRWQTCEYKLLNILVQGSAADCTKEGIINYGYADKKTGRFLIQVHDELVCSVPKSNLVAGMRRLETAMESIKFKVAMLSDGDYSEKSYGELEKYNEEEVQFV